MICQVLALSNALKLLYMGIKMAKYVRPMEIRYTRLVLIVPFLQNNNYMYPDVKEFTPDLVVVRTKCYSKDNWREGIRL